MKAVTIKTAVKSWPVEGAFTISRGSRTEAVVVEVHVCGGGITGKGECVPYPRYGESVEGVCLQIAQAAMELNGMPDRSLLQKLVPAGAARNGLDCALWDYEAKSCGRRVWDVAGLPVPEPVYTAYTLSLDSAEAMGNKARANAHRPVLKVKLGGEGDMERIRAVHANAPSARLIIDANEAWTVEQYIRLAPQLAEQGVALVEQPLPASDDAGLGSIERPVPVCADESCHDRATLAELAGRYDAINIKLDKTGGVTEALALCAEAKERGFIIMVGCMLGSSLSMAAAHLVAQQASFIDIDGPLLLAADQDCPLQYEGSLVHPPRPELWG
ncbi:N-acetyl-D-Glu racemase DgcA [Oleidesulfovibrio sp.]|uniref:N-acetyl-D-Glu racemase DgcA n=1 Tax=Oleidesulfovibrio sp. TaxID=2909707 RepID=UPI003A87A718